MSHCWFDFENGHTCMLERGPNGEDHDGPHEPTSDDDIFIRFDPTTGVEPGEET